MNSNENINFNEEKKITLRFTTLLTLLVVLLTFATAFGIRGYKANKALEIAEANREKLIVLERIDERLNNIEDAMKRLENKD
jgi:hypothetical protein